MEKTKTPQGSFFSDMRFLMHTIGESASRAATTAALLVVIGVVMNFVSWIAVPAIIAQVETAESVAALLITVCAAIMLLWSLRWLWTYVDGSFTKVCDRFRTVGSTRLAQKALTLSYPLCKNAHSRTLLRQASEAMGTHIDAPVPHIWRSLSMLFIHAAGLLLYAALLWRFHAWLLLITAVIAVVRAAVHRTVTKWGHRHREEEAALDAELAYVPRVVASSRFSKEIRVFGLKSWLTALHDSSMRVMDAFIRRRAKVYLLYTIADAVLTFLSNAVAYTALISATVTTNASVWEFLLYFTAIGGFTQSVGWAIDDMLTLRREIPCLRAYCTYLRQKEPFCTQGGGLPARGIAHTLTLRDVSFTAPDTAVSLSHVNMTLHAGERLAVICEDATACAALTQLLCGLCDPDEGAVLLDDTDVRTLDRRAYYELLSAVLSEEPLWGMTVKEFIGGQDVDEVLVWDALDKTDLSKTVCAMPHGLHTPLVDNAMVSIDEKERLMLARAAVHNGDIFVINEPRASLDAQALQALYSLYDRLTAGKSTVFLSSHPVSSVLCDRVVVIENGIVIEDGTSAALIAHGGVYARLLSRHDRDVQEGRVSK